MIKLRVGDIVRISSKDNHVHNKQGIITIIRSFEPVYTVITDDNLRLLVHENLVRLVRSSHIFQYSVNDIVSLIDGESGKIESVYLKHIGNEPYILYDVRLKNYDLRICATKDLEE